MKTILGLSIFLNAALLGLALSLWIVGKKNVPAPIPVITESPVAVSAPETRTLHPATPPPFRWSQLDSRDYHVYIKNLRAIGCPETSVRAIAAADADVVYNERRRALQNRLAELAGGSWSNQVAAAISEPALRAELQHLPEEESRLIAELLGLSAPANPVVATAPPAGDSNQAVALPLVFQDIDPVKLGLSAEEQQTLAELRQSFMTQVGGPNQNPNDPAYLARWQAAQLKIDSLLEGMLGDEIYNKIQMIEYQQSINDQASGNTSMN